MRIEEEEELEEWKEWKKEVSGDSERDESEEKMKQGKLEVNKLINVPTLRRGIMQQSVQRHSFPGSALSLQQISPGGQRHVGARHQVSNLEKGFANHKGGFVGRLDLVFESRVDSQLEHLPEFVIRDRVK